MPDIATVLKAEIRRLAKSEIRSATGPLKKQVAGLRTSIRKAKDDSQQLKHKVTALQRATGDTDPAPPPDMGRSWITSRTVRALRKRLGLTQVQMGKVLGVSGLTIYNWEKGVTKPRASLAAKIVASKKLGKKDVKDMLARS